MAIALKMKKIQMILKIEIILLMLSMLFSSTMVNAAVANLNSPFDEWSPSNSVDMSPLFSSASNDVLEVLQEQTSSAGLLDDSFDTMTEQTLQIRNQLQANVYEYEYLRNALDSMTAGSGSLSALANASPQQLQIINDAVSMLGANYAYDATQREIDLRRDSIAAAYEDLSNAERIVIDDAMKDASNWQRTRQVREYVLSAVRHLQDSCPLCRALKYAASDANLNLLPFVAVLCSSILKTLHPFLADPYSS